MTIGDIVYGDVVRLIAKHGEWDYHTPVRTKYATDGAPAYTKSILNVQMKYDNSKEVLESILSQKRVPRKDPVQEMFWIWKYKSNSVRFLRDVLGCTVWDEWERPDGTIGKSYGYQLGKKSIRIKADSKLKLLIDLGNISAIINPEAFKNEDYVWIDQVDYLIYELTFNSHSRRIKTTLWCAEDLWDMALPPCVYETHWQTWGGKLNLTVNVRSNDLGLGNPYNTYQYSILHRLIAQVTGHEAGEICFNIDNAHIYDRHMDILLEQIEAPMHDAPTVWINPEVTSFYDFTIDDIKVENYVCEKSRRMEIAI